MSKFLTQNETAVGLIDARILKALAVLTEETSIQKLENAACVVADVFGAEGSFAVLTKQKNAARDEVEQKLIGKFHKNLQLLIKKSWVEKFDEALKEQVLCRLEKFQEQIERFNYSSAYKDFLEVLTDTVYLMFGSQSKKDDFTEYALRIDPEFGVFWLYVQTLSAQNDNSARDNERCRIMLLLGIVFLANY